MVRLLTSGLTDFKVDKSFPVPPNNPVPTCNMATRRSVFISYASEHGRVAEAIALAVRELNLNVFVDRDNLQPGLGYHDRIHSEIDKCDVFVFLLTKEAIAEDRYTMSELKFAQQKWPVPGGHVLTVPIGQYDKTKLPPYLGAATFVSIVGNVPTNVRAEVRRLVHDHIQSEKTTARIRQTLGTFLKGGVCKPAAYVNSDDLNKVLERKLENGGRIAVSELKDELDKHAVPSQPHWLMVEGVFFPGALMSTGWWRRSNKTLMKMKWNDPSWQGWLFSGFEQWAPSWNINDWSRGSPLNLVGQVGAHDEADSIPVLVKSARKAAQIRDDLGDEIVLNAQVRGLLCHESHFPKLDQLSQSDKSFFDVIKSMTESQYYILVFDDDDAHNDVTFLRKKVEFYSGYLWQCWSPKEWTPSDPFNTKLPGAYFVWEHTNFADRDVVRFGLDSLGAKLGFLRQRLQKKDLSGDMILLQHLMPNEKLTTDSAGSAQPAIPIEHFTNLFAHEESGGDGG